MSRRFLKESESFLSVGGLEDQADQFALDHDGLDQSHTLGQLGNLGIGQSGGHNFLVGGVGGHNDVGLHLAADLNGHLHGGSHGLAMEGVWDGVDFKLVSADRLGFKPWLVIP